ncbi:MAG: ATP-binding domain-containing protein, partial [Lachnospiraceae bacterium]|nr:ATP-binding domain-containing protein [Lachnospiraceae bacterium]
LILSPNRIFAEYISDVLPELGEQNICEVSFDDIARRETAGMSEIEECEPKQEQLEFIIRCEPDDARLQQIRFKRSLLFLRELQAFVRELEDSLVTFSDYTFSLPARTQDDCARSYTVTADELRKLYCGNFSALPVFQRLGQIAERIAEHFESEHHISLSTLRRDEIVQGLYAMCRTTNVRALYTEFLRSISEKYSVLENGGNAGEGCLRYEDIFPVVLMKLLLFGRPNSRFDRIRHVVVDEMQDYSMVQYELLRVLFRCSMTILGDTGQMLDCGGDTLLDDIRGVFGPKTTLVRLEKSYRSTLEISEFCRRLGRTSGTQAFARRGKAPALEKCLDYPDMILRLQGRMDRIDPSRTATAAVICKTATAAERLYLALDSAHRERCHRMNAEDDDFEKGILITNSCLAKGLEFDLVIVPEADAEEYHTDRDRRILYIACTRALHELELLYFGAPSPFLIFGDVD